MSTLSIATSGYLPLSPLALAVNGLLGIDFIIIIVPDVELPQSDHERINRTLRYLVGAVNPAIPIVIRGVQYPTQEDDFLEFNLLAVSHELDRPGRKNYRYSVELKCFSRHTNVRVDGNRSIDPHYDLAEPYIKLFNQKRHLINNTCIQFTEPTVSNLDLSSLGDFAQGIDQQSPKLNLFALVIQVTGTIIQ